MKGVRENWIRCVLDMTAMADDQFTPHVVFAHKVLGEPWSEAFKFGAAFRRHPLTRADCEGLITDWIEEGWLPA